MKFKGTGYPSNPNQMSEMIPEEVYEVFKCIMSNFAESSPRVQSMGPVHILH